MITIKEPSNHAVQQGCKCEIEVNHLPLDILSMQPHGLEANDSMYGQYNKKLEHLLRQDHLLLEGNKSLDEVRDCPTCGAKDSVRPTGRGETTKNTRTIELECEKCGAKFKDMGYGSNDGLNLHD
ncbi:MAG: hypothetical protein ACRD5B_13530 [Nitrososphaeraceae archaeon]